LKFAFEALGTLLTETPALLLDRAIIVLGGAESVKTIDLRRLAGYRKGETAHYIRRSTSCIRSFLLLVALHACLYDAQTIALIMTHMISLSGLSENYPVAAQQIEKLVGILQPFTKSFLEDVTECNMQVLSIAAESSDMKESHAACEKLAPDSMASLLVHSFQAISTASKKKYEHTDDTVELRGATGLFDLVTILLWLMPTRFALSLRYSSDHPTCRAYSIGSGTSPLIVQLSLVEIEDKKATSGWCRIAWSSAQSITKNALEWVGVANPLMPGTAGLFGGVALTAAKKFFT
jgi:hypothetical protein